MLTSVRSVFAATLLAGCSLAASPVLAQEATDPPKDFTVTGGVTLTTDYRFRGVSLSAGDPAVQGTINLNHSSGFYIGTWSSSISGGAVYGNQELDLYGGWTGEVSPGLTADVGLLYYAYPGGHVGTAEYFEPYASISTTLGPAKAKLGAAYAWKQDGLGGDDNLYVYTNLDVGVPNTPFTVSGHLGYTDGPLAPPFLAGTSDTSGLDWSVGASATVLGNLTASVAYVGVEGPAIDGFTDDTVVGTLTLSF